MKKRALMVTPCGNLIEREPAECGLGNKVPHDCRGCTQYEPGITNTERLRSLAWFEIQQRIGLSELS